MSKDFNYIRGKPVDVHAEFGVDQISQHNYRGRKPLIRPRPDARGVFGGNLAGQALLVAIRSSPPEFKPHSLHSFFVRAANDKTPIAWEVSEVSNGKTFVNRSIKGIQDGQIVYIANISLTKRNSHKEAVRKYEEYYAKIEQRAKESDEDEEEEEDDDAPAPPKPFVFQTPYHE
ncbi:TES1, partial [[Candida] subhashii]